MLGVDSKQKKQPPQPTQYQEHLRQQGPQGPIFKLPPAVLGFLLMPEYGINLRDRAAFTQTCRTFRQVSNDGVSRFYQARALAMGFQHKPKPAGWNLAHREYCAYMRDPQRTLEFDAAILQLDVLLIQAFMSAGYRPSLNQLQAAWRHPSGLAVGREIANLLEGQFSPEQVYAHALTGLGMREALNLALEQGQDPFLCFSTTFDFERNPLTREFLLFVSKGQPPMAYALSILDKLESLISENGYGFLEPMTLLLRQFAPCEFDQELSDGPYQGLSINSYFKDKIYEAIEEEDEIHLSALLQLYHFKEEDPLESVKRLFNETIELFSTEKEAQAITLLHEILTDEALPIVLGDEIRGVLIKILKVKAFKYSDEGKIVEAYGILKLMKVLEGSFEVEAVNVFTQAVERLKSEPSCKEAMRGLKAFELLERDVYFMGMEGSLLDQLKDALSYIDREGQLRQLVVNAEEPPVFLMDAVLKLYEGKFLTVYAEDKDKAVALAREAFEKDFSDNWDTSEVDGFRDQD